MSCGVWDGINASLVTAQDNCASNLHTLPQSFVHRAIHLEENLRRGKDSSMKRGLKISSLRVDGEAENWGRAEEWAETSGKMQRESQKCEGE